MVGRLTRSRAGLPPSYHRAPSTNAQDFAVTFEFGADLWTLIFQAAFSDLKISQADFPIGIEFGAWDGERNLSRLS